MAKPNSTKRGGPTTHGCTANGITTPEYRLWYGMKDRCYNRKAKKFKHYGGRGIRVCDRWKNSFANFLEDMGQRPAGLTLDRRRTNGDYEPGNCRWATKKEQQRNKRNNRVVLFRGRRLCLAAWAEEFNICRKVVCARLSIGWTMERALTTPVR